MNATPPNTHKGACWCPRCKEEGAFAAPSLQATYRLVCEACGRSTSHSYCEACGTTGPIKFPLPEPDGPWTCSSCGVRHIVPTDFLASAIVFTLRHQGPDAPPMIKTGFEAWRGVLRMMLILGVLIWIYYQFFYEWP